MFHVPIVNTVSRDKVLEFSHFDQDAQAGHWKKETVIMRDCIKLNVFVEGSFSVFSDGTLHYPVYGDVCFLPPMKMHYGQITRPMHISYYQLDIGEEAFASVPGGDVLLSRLIELTLHGDSFLRPSQGQGGEAIRLCEEIEAAMQKEEFSLAYAKVIELLSMLYPLYLAPARVTGDAFSLRTEQIIRYVEKHYAEDVTVAGIAEELGVSTSFLSRVFKREIGITIHEFLNQYRILRSVSLLDTHSVTQTGYLCGFCDNSHFISVFKKHMGVTPMQYKNAHAGSK